MYRRILTVALAALILTGTALPAAAPTGNTTDAGETGNDSVNASLNQDASPRPGQDVVVLECLPGDCGNGIGGGDRTDAVEVYHAGGNLCRPGDCDPPCDDDPTRCTDVSKRFRVQEWGGDVC